MSAVDPYELLATAIITQATEDYRSALDSFEKADKHVKKAEEYLKDLQNQIKMAKIKLFNAKEQFNEANGRIYSLEEFFYGDWFTKLSGGAVNPDYIINRIKAEREATK